MYSSTCVYTRALRVALLVRTSLQRAQDGAPEIRCIHTCIHTYIHTYKQTYLLTYLLTYSLHVCFMRAGAPATPDNVKFKCGSKGCACKHFFFIVAEGAWILRCRCKHKHIEHDCGSKPFKCKKPRCTCNGFDRCDVM